MLPSAYQVRSVWIGPWLDGVSGPGFPFPLTIMDFQERFATEEACRAYLFECRWPEGFRCRRCGGGEVGVMHRSRRVWQCKSWGADFGDGGNGDARHAPAAPAVVLGGLPGRHAPSGDLRGAAAAPAWGRLARDGVGDAAQAAPGDGRA